MRGKLLTEEQKGSIVGAMKAGLTTTQAADILGSNIATVRRTWLHYCSTGSTQYENRCGRHKKLSSEGHEELVKLATTNRRMPLSELGTNMEPRVSRATVRKELDIEHIHRRKARRKPTLKAHHKVARVKFSRDFIARGMDVLNHIIWSDESYIVIGGTKGAIYVSRKPCEEFDEECTLSSDEQSKIRIMVWGCIMRGRKGPLVVLEYPGGKGGGMSSVRYVQQVLEPVLAPFYHQMEHEQGEVFFQQDNAKCHTACNTSLCLQTMAIQRFPHPAKSPDLTPIEPVWHDFKEAIRVRHEASPITSKEELRQVVAEVWDALDVSLVNAHVGRMPKALDEVLARNGAMTRY